MAVNFVGESEAKVEVTRVGLRQIFQLVLMGIECASRNLVQ